MSATEQPEDPTVAKIERYRQSLEQKRDNLGASLKRQQEVIERLTKIRENQVNKFFVIETKIAKTAGALEAAKVVHETLALIDADDEENPVSTMTIVSSRVSTSSATTEAHTATVDQTTRKRTREDESAEGEEVHGSQETEYTSL